VPGFFEGELKLTFTAKVLTGYDPVRFFVRPSF
jgi:hypothetical protein